MANQLANIASAAARNITPETWCQGEYGHGGRHCVIGHVMEAARAVTDAAVVPLDVWWPIVHQLNTTVGMCIKDYNDTAGRTCDDVRQALLQAAMALGK
jgi:hypothetical protein